MRFREFNNNLFESLKPIGIKINDGEFYATDHFYERIKSRNISFREIATILQKAVDIYGDELLDPNLGTFVLKTRQGLGIGINKVQQVDNSFKYILITAHPQMRVGPGQSVIKVLEEGPMWDRFKKKAAGAAIAGGLVGAAASQLGDKPNIPSFPTNDTPAITRSIQAEPKDQDDMKKQYAAPIKSTSQTANQKIQDQLLITAMSAGIMGEELAAFMAQMAHETLSFSSFEEKGSDAYFKRMYDIKGEDPDKAKLLGNLKPGDGIRYKGRGYIHLTGKDNYEKAEKATGHPLLKHPELASKSQVAADIAVWFWTTRVRPNVSDWSDTRSVTRKINPAMLGLDDRKANFLDYKEKLKV
jgi:predicted chitinase